MVGTGAECAEPPCLAPPAEGVQFRSEGTVIRPGEDVEYCEVVAIPGGPDETYYVNRIESEMTRGSHHLIVQAIEVGHEGNVKAGDKVSCFSPSVFGERQVGVTGSQQQYREESYPEGVGRVFQGGQLVVMDYHYFNTTDEPLIGRAAVNLHTVPAEKVTRIARGFGFYNLAINAPPRTAMGPTASSFEKTCNFSHDVLVQKLTRHTHQWGTDFKVWFAGGDRDGELAMHSDDYEDVDHEFDEPILLKAGEGFRFECSYLNTEDKALQFGIKASDEMCILFGTWWAPEVGRQVPGQGCGL